MKSKNTSPVMPLPSTGFVRLPQVLAVIPWSKSAIYQAIREGRFPAPVKLGPRTAAWSVDTLREWIDKANADANQHAA
ncbi:helix-turn-helix transcriptional regulator [Geomonas ferrireducens]|uniref:helix-turn-helix transcriptional regulator n=1 Tax=Geomonas ferrireducens TaxID=2570227 RepID=UPI0010A7816A|nr:AlpA family phage regulatory protein [Geomonas ferrireducens]